MTNFYLGILVGFFHGAMVVFVVLRIICFSFERRLKQSALAGPRAARECPSTCEAILFSHQGTPRPPLIR
jgi:hypothetical protein